MNPWWKDTEIVAGLIWYGGGTLLFAAPLIVLLLRGGTILGWGLG